MFKTVYLFLIQNIRKKSLFLVAQTKTKPIKIKFNYFLFYLI